MSDERGGRYFREARFFFAGDKVAAQSHTPEARLLMGQMRDMRSLGGPAIQAQYVTLSDGTRIKATMMNGQYQAEIVSQVKRKAVERQRVLTIVGDYVNAYGYGQGFKWQESTGIIRLDRAGHNYCTATQVSYDGMYVLGMLFDTSLFDAVDCVWDNDGAVTVLGAPSWGLAVRDITFGGVSSIPVPYAPDINYDLYRHRFNTAKDHLFLGSHNLSGTTTGAMVVERDAVTGNETVILLDTTAGAGSGFSYAYGASETGNTIIGMYPAPGFTGPYTYRGEYVVLWERPDAFSAYTARVIPGITNIAALSISDDGKIVFAEVERPRFQNGGDLLVVDNSPAVYTDAYGILQLIPFDPNPIANQYVNAFMSKGSSDGTAAIGGFYQGSTPRPLAWKSIDVVNGTFEPIPALTGINEGAIILNHIN